MIDFNKKIRNSDKFRKPAIKFSTTGAYCHHPKGTTEYYDFWRTEQEYCLRGYTAEDGDFIPGYYYFYLNYCPITRTKWEKLPNRKGQLEWRQTDAKDFPDFFDYDYFYYEAIELAEEEGKHLAVAKSRRKGYSLKGASMLCRNYYLIPFSKSYVYVSNKQYLTEDGILTKAWEYMDFIEEHTGWGKKRLVDTANHKKSGFVVIDDFGNKVEAGYKSEIIGLSLKDNPSIVRGKRGKLILFEEAGSFSELAAAWQIARPSVEQDGRTFGIMIMFGTGGDSDRAIDALRTAFFDPAQYNCLAFDNIWDDGAQGTKCGFFIPQYTNLNNRGPDGERLYMDEDGNTLTAKAKAYVLSLRAEELANAKNSLTVDRYTAERAITPAEAFMQLSGNIFPKKELQKQLARIRTNKDLRNMKQVGDLIWVDGKIQWSPKKMGDITKFPLGNKLEGGNGDDPTGSIVIWEHPVPDSPVGLYIAGIDPYDHDQAGTNSLGSTFIYKRFQNFEEYYDIIVAEYTGRPSTADEYYENVRKLLTYYNARAMYENEKKGLFTYFANKHADYMLADQPEILRDIVTNSNVRRGKGCHMTKEIKLWGEGKIKEWLEDELSPGVLRLTTIYSEPLLEELIQYNDKGNFDRVMALLQVMVYREQLYTVQVKQKHEVIKKTSLFDGPLFTADFYKNKTTINEIPVLEFNYGT